MLFLLIGVFLGTIIGYLYASVEKYHKHHPKLYLTIGPVSNKKEN